VQSNWKDLVLEQDRDVVGFGVALSRPESTLPRLCPLPRRPSPHSLLTLTPLPAAAVDDPTQVRIVDISISPVSKSSFEVPLHFYPPTNNEII
jgi:hypothetical protein